MNGELCIFQKFPTNFPTLFPTFTFDVVFKKKACQKEFHCRVAFISYSTENERKLCFVFQNFSRSNTGLVYFTQLSTNIN